MFFRLGSKSGEAVASAGQAIEEIHGQLQQLQKGWAEKLAQDPACFATLEHEIHQRFGQLADRLVASLLGGVAGQAALEEAAKKKVTEAGRPFRSPQQRGRRVRLLGGLILFVSTAYYAVVNRTGKGRGRAGSGLYPELAVLGIHHGKSAALADRVARRSALLPSFEHAQRELNSEGLNLPLKEVRRIATHLGAQVLTGRKRDLLDYRDGRMPAGGELAGKRVACCIDAGKSRLRRVTRKQRGKGKDKKQRRRYKTAWRDVKLLIIYEIDEKGQKVRTSRPWIDGTFAGPDEAMELVAMHLHRLGAAKAEVVVFLSDGAPWIWERLEWVAKRVGLRREQWQFVLDFWHAAQHIGLALGHVPIADKERRRLYRKLRKWLKGGKGWEMTQELRRLGEEHGVLEAMAEDLGYLEKHEDHAHMDYARFLRQGLPIGSGAVESAIRRVINLRIKGPAILWEEENAEAMVVLRAAALSGRWEELLDRTRQSFSRDRRIDIRWTSPDMRAELKAGVTVTPATPQVQGEQPLNRLLA